MLIYEMLCTIFQKFFPSIAPYYKITIKASFAASQDKHRFHHLISDEAFLKSFVFLIYGAIKIINKMEKIVLVMFVQNFMEH